MTNQVSDPRSVVAIVGMAGRFPGAPDVNALWERVRRGDDCLTDLVADELIAAGLPPTLVRSPDYVLRAGMLDDVAGFDAELFGISPRDAALMDPQHRHFLECAWAALESAGCVPERFDGAIGVFAGCGMNTYLLNNLVTNPELVEQVGWFLLRHTGNDKDFLPTFVSYKLDLRGPSVSVQTACSTSLVAIHLAVQSLLSLECDLALAGGVTIEVPHGNGYTYRPGEILAPDGRCRAFDAESAGTVLTSGAGVVALRRLADAIDDGDPVLAVISGTAVNNDGRRKVGFLAPSVDGHADVVKEALAVAGLSARDIQLVEAHGTGTAVGDPIEVAALTEAFHASTAERGFCRLSSTKPNVGHLDTAAGVASVIKVVQALRHATLPPLANHTEPSPLLGIEQTPFVLRGAAEPWPETPVRRAGVSSLGVGGTNAHAIIEEAPRQPPTAPPDGEQVLCLSAATAAALDEGGARLAGFLSNTDVNLADVAHTLAAGRRAMTRRRVVVASDATSAAELVSGRTSRRSATGVADLAQPPTIAFLFPGGGSQYPGMAAGFDARFEAFHSTWREGIAAVSDAGGPDLAPLLLSRQAPAPGDEAALQRADVSLPAVFITSVALARQWLAWGVEPHALVGHSLGEYVAAHLAGVLDFADAVGLVVTRSRLMAQASAGGAAMLAVPLDEASVRAELPIGLSLSLVNADDECVVSGAAADIDEYSAQLAVRGVVAQSIALAAAAHSSLLDPVCDDFLAAVKSVTLRPPRRRYLSNVTGGWITPAQATDPQYWVDHLRNTVRFADGLRTLLAEGPTVTVELGPGQALSSYARRQRPAPVAAIAALRHRDDPTPDSAHTLLAFAKQWVGGADVDLRQFSGSGRRKLHLPTYAFQHQRHWIEPGGGTVTRVVSDPMADDDRLRRLPAVGDWFWEPTWVEQPPLGTETVASRRIVLVADRDDVLAEQLVLLLRARGHTVVAGEALDPEALPTANTVVILDPPREPVQDAAERLDAAAARWLGQAVDAVRVIGPLADGGTRLVAVTRGATNVSEPAPRPHHALAIGPVLVAPKEYPGLTAALVDVDRELPPVAAIVAEIEAATTAVVAYRGGVRHTLGHRHEATREPAAGAFRKGGVYVVTGALGAVGSVIATHLAVAHRAKLVVVSSRPLPPEDERDRWLRSHGSDDSTSRRIHRLRDLERLGTTVVTVTADIADRAALSQALDSAERAIGPITGGVHAAGVLRDRLLAVASPDDLRTVLSAKAVGAAHLADELDARGAELLVLTSSTSTLLAAPGQSAYVAANSYLDALAGQRGRLRVVTINFGAWAGPGMAADAARQARLGLSAGEPVTHPVFTSRRVDGTAIELIGQLDSRYDWLLDEHRTASGLAVLPGAGHAELMLGALALVGAPLGLRDVALLRPLAIPEDAPAVVRVRLEAPGDDGSRRVWLDASPEPGSGWVRYSEAVAEDPAAEPPPPPQPADRAGWTPFDPLERPRRDLVLGRRWECVVSATRNGNRAVADLALSSEFGDEPAWWRAHPALVDAATAVAVGLATQPSEQLLVPAGYDRVTVYGPVGPAIGAIAELRSSDGRSLLVDVTLMDADAVRARFEGIRLRGVDPGAFGTMEDEVAEARLAAAGAFIELAERLGIRASDAPEVLERAVGSGLPRLIASSVDLDQLLVRSAPPDDPKSSGIPTTKSTTTAEGTTSERLTAIWCDLLGVAEVAPDADFFDLGGHSLIAIRLMARIQRELGVQLPIAAIIEARTIGALAAMIADERPDLDPAQPAQPGGDASPAPSAGSGSRYKPIMALRAAGSRQPLFVVHGATGEVLFLHTLVRHLDPDRPVYGIHAIGTDSRDRPDPSVEAMVDRYIDALIAEHAEPYLLGGYSGGGIIVIEMARQLQARGKQVTAVILFDCVARGLVPWSRRLVWSNVAKHLITSGPTAIRPYLSQRLALRLRRMAPVSRRTQGSATTDGDGTGTTVDLFGHFTEIAARFEMRAVDADVILLKAEQSWPALPGDYYWTPYVNGMLRIEYVGGHHNSMFDVVNAPGLGRRVETIIAEYGDSME